MSEAPDGRTVARAINRFTLWFCALVVVAEVVLFTAGRASAASGVLVSPFLVGALAWRFRRVVRTSVPKGPRPGGIFVQAATIAMPAVVLIFVGYLIGDDVAQFICTAIGSTYVGVAGLIVAMARLLPAP